MYTYPNAAITEKRNLNISSVLNFPAKKYNFTVGKAFFGPKSVKENKNFNLTFGAKIFFFFFFFCKQWMDLQTYF